MSDFIDPDLFPDRADLSYRVAGGQDLTGGPKPTYQPGPTAVPCSIQDAAVLDTNTLRIVGTKIDSAVWFDAAATTSDAVRLLKRGGLLTLTRGAGGPALVHEVVRVDFMGIGDLAVWQVSTIRRE